MKAVLSSNDGHGHLTVLTHDDTEIRVDPGRNYIPNLEIGDILEIDTQPGYVPTVMSKFQSKPEGTRFCVPCRVYYSSDEITQKSVSQKWGAAYFDDCPNGHTLGSHIELGAIEAARLDRQVKRPMSEFLEELELEKDRWPTSPMGASVIAEIAAKQKREAANLVEANRLAETTFESLADAEEAAEDGDLDAVRFFNIYDKL